MTPRNAHRPGAIQPPSGETPWGHSDSCVLRRVLSDKFLDTEELARRLGRGRAPFLFFVWAAVSP